MKNKNTLLVTRTFDELLSLVSSFQESMNECNDEKEKLKIATSFFKDINVLQKQVISEYFSGEFDGNSLFLQGISLPIVVNSICDEFGEWKTSDCSIHIGKIDGEDKVIVTPNIISIP